MFSSQSLRWHQKDGWKRTGQGGGDLSLWGSEEGVRVERFRGAYQVEGYSTEMEQRRDLELSFEELSPPYWGLLLMFPFIASDYKLPLTIWFYRDKVTGHCSHWPSTHPERSSEWRSEGKYSVKNWQNRPSDRHFQEKTLWVQFLPSYI